MSELEHEAPPSGIRRKDERLVTCPVCGERAEPRRRHDASGSVETWFVHGRRDGRACLLLERAAHALSGAGASVSRG